MVDFFRLTGFLSRLTIANSNSTPVCFFSLLKNGLRKVSSLSFIKLSVTLDVKCFKLVSSDYLVINYANIYIF